MIRRLKTLRVFAYIFMVLTVLEVSSYVFFAISNRLTDDFHYLELIFAFATPTVIVIWGAFLIKYYELKIIFRSLKVENQHYLGFDTKFYNLPLFEKTVKSFPKDNENRTYYLMQFTPCSQDVSNNITRNAIIVKYNGLISLMIHDYFEENKMYNIYDNAYCFYRGAFNIFIRGDKDRIDSILRDFEKRLYELAKVNEIRIFVQPFFGITSFHKGDDLHIAMENATLARLQSESNFELSTYYDPNLRNTSLLSDSEDIMAGLKDKEFVVYYQPKFSLDSKTFISSEALVRWNSKKLGFLNPAMFIEKAEKAGLIHEIDMYVFSRVCEDLNESRRRGRRILPVSINFSLYEFFSPNFVEDIVNIIDTNNIPHNLIEIEITETTTQSNPFLSISIMKRLKKEGLRILMDDFGVGFSNFSNMRKMPFDAIKIDKSFVDAIVDDSKTREIMKFLINLGKVNNLEVIAEGVDNKQQVEILTKAKLDTIQGYYYSKPLSNKEYNDFLKNNPFEKKGELSK